jgi:2-dehydro-3-deoxyphosphooctonate aldolase (KDO 8-P synthase)|tara:strand:- start:456 stop:1214 length:759 start_codon:yes stop_codon:yes gene_type:complete
MLMDKFIISGPCVIESEYTCMKIAEKVKELTAKYGFDYIFKASFDKANRTSVDSYRGPGLQEGLEILAKVKKEFDVQITTDIHEPIQAIQVKDVVDVIQIPAFLCRQTDLLLAAGRTGKTVNIKKAQFMSGNNMEHPIKKVQSTCNNNIMVTERGTMFGLGNLVVDFRQILDMKKFNVPIVMDVTHSTQKPSALGNKSGGDRKYAPYIAKLAQAVDVDGYFFEVHPDPDNALSDGPNMVPLNNFETILKFIA